jgi:type IV pilus assembly protein PilC
LLPAAIVATIINGDFFFYLRGLALGAMPKYSYRAINAKGRPVRGVVSAANESDLTTRLDEGGLALVDCKEMSDKSSKLKALTARKIKLRDLIQMFIHLSQLQKAGVPLLDGLSDVRDTTDSPRLRDVMSDVYREVAEGSSFSNALSKHPGIFEPIFISLISSGEETGNLVNAFEQVIRHLKWTDAMRTKVKKATRYPKILVGVVLIVIYVMMGYVVPQVVGFLKDIGKTLPPTTLALIWTSEFFSNYFMYIIGAMFGFYAFLRIGRTLSEEFRFRTDYVALRMPVMGSLIRKISLSQFCQTFGILFTSGLEILKCIDSAAMTASNVVLIDALSNVRQQVQEGSPLSAAMGRSGEFPSLVVRMVKVGEESGNLSGVLEQVSEFYDKDVNEAVDAMIQMIEPTLTVILGGIILWIAAAVFGPIYDSFGSMG